MFGYSGTLAVVVAVSSCSAGPPPAAAPSKAGSTSGFELAVVPRLDADNPRVGRASWQYDRERYAPTETASNGQPGSRAHAEAHQSIDTLFAAFDEGACAHFDAETRTTCPLLSVVEAVEEIPEGVRVRILRSVDLRAALDHMRCHHAFGRSRGYREMDACPLYVHGIDFSPVPALHAIEIRSPSAAAVRGIQERALLHGGGK